MKSKFPFALLLSLLFFCSHIVASKKTIVFVPLDERYATRGLWLNLVRLAQGQYDVKTPPLDLICRRKVPGNIPMLQNWLTEHVPASHSVVLSFEQLVYGGLIASRTGNESLSIIEERLGWLVSLRRQHARTKFYLSTTVMRIPSYNGDFEEPWYWKFFGTKLYQYSFYLGRYEALGNASDLEIADEYKSEIPAAVVRKFLWRRERNFNVTTTLFELQKEYNSLFDALYLTLDDSGRYGLNVVEAQSLQNLSKALNLNPEIVRIYPGADEVQSCLLSKLIVTDAKIAPKITVLWRMANATKLIPNYENQPIQVTVEEQLGACGGTVISSNDADIVFAVNNFDSYPQLESSQQAANPAEDYHIFFQNVRSFCEKGNAIVGFADVRYSNGGDLSFSKYILNLLQQGSKNANKCISAGLFGYAGWNTDGNTLGTVAANAVILTVFNDAEAIRANKRFTLLRFLEDVHYQSIVRTDLMDYVVTSGDSVNNLSTDLLFYEKYSYKLLAHNSAALAKLLMLNFTSFPPLHSAYYPWNRTFEIGLELNAIEDLTSSGNASPFSNEQTVFCDVIIGGGSTSALAAAFAAADEGPSLSVCLLEPTSWPGGQLTSSLVTALDFGKLNRKIQCLPKLFAQYLEQNKYPQNPGNCWVSTFCYEAEDILNSFIFPELKKRENLHVYLNTVVSRVITSKSFISNIVAITRTAKSNYTLSIPYSQQVTDWYSSQDSADFFKTIYTFSRTPKTSPIVIDATENGDLLALSGAPFIQGNELNESSFESLQTCGQGIAFTMYMSIDQENKEMGTHQGGKGGGPNIANNYSLGKYDWENVWSYRRVENPKTTLIAWGSTNGDGNDWPYSYHLLPVKEARKQDPWVGGLNLTTLQRAEEYALGFAKWYMEKGLSSGMPPAKLINSSKVVGTMTGLAQLPYIRDSRRSIGLNQFRLKATDLAKGKMFNDRVALGDYIYFDAHSMQGCPAINFTDFGPLQPYYIPLRALTSNGFSNLLVAGKTMAQTNAANAATRFQPVEWSSGTASGVFASFLLNERMKGNNISIAGVCSECQADEGLCALQTRVAEYNPLDWSCA